MEEKIVQWLLDREREEDFWKELLGASEEEYRQPLTFAACAAAGSGGTDPGSR